MGCDIHGRVQIKRWDGQTAWEDLGEIPDDRNYHLFTALAGVRGLDESPRISEPRGLPEDFPIDGDYHMVQHGYAEPPCVEEYWMGDHSFSWLTLDEMLAWDGWAETRWCEGWVAWLNFLSKYYEGRRVRIVFGFDN